MKVDLSQLVTSKEKAAAAEATRLDADRRAALRHLAETDWYVTRQVETGKPVPDDILKSREEARARASSPEGVK